MQAQAKWITRKYEESVHDYLGSTKPPGLQEIFSVAPLGKLCPCLCLPQWLAFAPAQKLSATCPPSAARLLTVSERWGFGSLVLCFSTSQSFPACITCTFRCFRAFEAGPAPPWSMRAWVKYFFILWFDKLNPDQYPQSRQARMLASFGTDTRNTMRIQESYWYVFSSMQHSVKLCKAVRGTCNWAIFVHGSRVLTAGTRLNKRKSSITKRSSIIFGRRGLYHVVPITHDGMRSSQSHGRCGPPENHRNLRQWLWKGMMLTYNDAKSQKNRRQALK